MKFRLFLSVLPFAAFFSSAFSITAEKIYFTLDGTQNSPSVEPGFNFNHIWNSMGVGQNGHIYAAVSNTAQSENPCGPPAKGDVCLVEYDPYRGTMKSCGTVKRACLAAGNWMPNESQEKIHTALTAAPGGKLWMATHDNGEVLPGDPEWYDGLFYRGSHLLYVDVLNGDTLVDHSKRQKYYYKKNDARPYPNLASLPPSDTSGIAVQWHSIMILGMNPHNPRYLWSETIAGSGFLQVWDLITDTTRVLGVGDGNMREMTVDRAGSLYFISGAGGNAYKRTINGVNRIVGSGLPAVHGTTAYSHSYDSAFSLKRGTGEVVLFDFVHDTVRQIGKLPGSGNGSDDYRTVAPSADGKKLYTIGNGKVHEFTIATGQSSEIYDVTALASGYSMISGRSIIDTLGNFYAGMHKGFTCGEACLLKINLGKNLVRPLPMPGLPNALEDSRMTSPAPEMTAHPNPCRTGSGVRVKAGGARAAWVFDSRGRLVSRLFPHGGPGDFFWQAENGPRGIYFVKAAWERHSLIHAIVKL